MAIEQGRTEGTPEQSGEQQERLKGSQRKGSTTDEENIEEYTKMSHKGADRETFGRIRKKTRNDRGGNGRQHKGPIVQDLEFEPRKAATTTRRTKPDAVVH
eukprot:10003483-Heterocapsa_arctica.AAC.1